MQNIINTFSNILGGGKEEKSSAETSKGAGEEVGFAYSCFFIQWFRLCWSFGSSTYLLTNSRLHMSAILPTDYRVRVRQRRGGDRLQ